LRVNDPYSRRCNQLEAKLRLRNGTDTGCALNSNHKVRKIRPSVTVEQTIAREPRAQRRSIWRLVSIGIGNEIS